MARNSQTAKHLGATHYTHSNVIASYVRDAQYNWKSFSMEVTVTGDGSYNVVQFTVQGRKNGKIFHNVFGQYDWAVDDYNGIVLGG